MVLGQVGVIDRFTCRRLFLRLLLISFFLSSSSFTFRKPWLALDCPTIELAPSQLPSYGDILLHNQQQQPSVFWNKAAKLVSTFVLIPLLMLHNPGAGGADDELARYAAEGNKVGVDAQCFFKQCAIETSACANDPTCLKGLSCLARCKGGSLCSTGCFAKYGSDNLDHILSCSVEKHDCVQVPGREATGWTTDTLSDLPGKPLSHFELQDLEGTWYKVMGLDSRYDCFDCQKNSFKRHSDGHSLSMEASFRIPRPSQPGYLQSKILEELHEELPQSAPADHLTPHLQSKGEMFGLTFWENWYVLGETKPTMLSQATGALHGLVSTASASDAHSATTSVQQPDLRLIFYTGHTLQGSYKGAFLYSRTKEMTPEVLSAAAEVIKSAGLNPNDFCMIRNQCFDKDTVTASTSKAAFKLATDDTASDRDKTPFWYLGQRFFQVTEKVAQELADWFQDPEMLSEWLISQQERVIFNQPLEVSPFASLPDSSP